MLTIDVSATVTVNTLTITGGNRGIANFGTVTLNDSTITGNLNPGGAVGGGIYNFQAPSASPGATVTLAGSSTITGNTASGGPNK